MVRASGSRGEDQVGSNRPEWLPNEPPIEVPNGVTSFIAENGVAYSVVRPASSLSVADKVKLVNEVLLPLRSYQMIGLIESRQWIEVLFPEFGDIRDREMDDYLRTLASQGPVLEEEEDVRSDQ